LERNTILAGCQAISDVKYGKLRNISLWHPSGGNAANMYRLNQINYEELKWGPFFKGADKPFQGMEHAELITVVQKDGMWKG
jgi:hypothetical protein